MPRKSTGCKRVAVWLIAFSSAIGGATLAFLAVAMEPLRIADSLAYPTTQAADLDFFDATLLLRTGLLLFGISLMSVYLLLRKGDGG